MDNTRPDKNHWLYNLPGQNDYLDLPQNSLLPAYREIERLFNAWEFRFEPKVELIKPVFAILNAGNRKALGWFVDNKWQTEKGDKLPEICVCAESLARDVHDIANTIVHEMAHLANAQLGIVDCHWSNQYHNKKFKIMAELGGLVCKRDSRRGWSITCLTDSARKEVDKLKINAYAFSIFRKSRANEIRIGPSTTASSGSGSMPTATVATRKQRKLVRWFCANTTSECVSVLVAAGSTLSAMCSNCQTPFVRGD